MQPLMAITVLSGVVGTSIVLPLKYLDDLKGKKNLTFAAFLETQARTSLI